MAASCGVRSTAEPVEAEAGAGIAVRDSKKPHGAVLTLTASQWRAFTRTIRADSD